MILLQLCESVQLFVFTVVALVARDSETVVAHLSEV